MLLLPRNTGICSRIYRNIVVLWKDAWLPCVGRDSSSDSPGIRQLDSDMLTPCSTCNDDGSLHTLMGALGSLETEHWDTHTHTLAVRTWLLVAFQRKEIEIHK